MRTKVIGCLLVLGGFVLAFAVMGLLALVSVTPEFSTGDKIARIDLEGMITSQFGESFFGGGDSMAEEFIENLKSAVEDESVKAIVLRINSPGGEITASDTIYNAVLKAREEKPIVVYMDSMAASGGYYVACAADEIIASETTLTGSIGVIIQTFSYYDLFGKVGLEALVFTSGEFKDTMNGAREMRSDEKAYIQSMVDQMYQKFLDVVSRGRGIPKDQLGAGIADGRVLSGKDALEATLVDANGFIDDAYDRARELGGAPDAEVIRYEKDESIFGIFGSAIQSRSGRAGANGKLEIDISDRLLPRLRPGMVYLLPSYYVP